MILDTDGHNKRHGNDPVEKRVSRFAGDVFIDNAGEHERHGELQRQ